MYNPLLLYTSKEERSAKGIVIFTRQCPIWYLRELSLNSNIHHLYNNPYRLENIVLSQSIIDEIITTLILHHTNFVDVISEDNMMEIIRKVQLKYQQSLIK